MKTRRRNNDTDLNLQTNMSPRPEKSPLSSPRTRSPVKGVRTGGTMCATPDALSMLNMLAEVASVTLHTDPAVTNTSSNKVKASSSSSSSNSGSKKPSEYELLTLEQVMGMTDNLLLKLFAEFHSNEMWRRFTYTCGMLPAVCSKYFQSFGSEHKARAGMKTHLQTHIKSLVNVHKSTLSQQSYLLESVPARKRRLAQQENTGAHKRTIVSNGRINKPTSSHKIQSHVGGNSSKVKKVATFIPEKENENVKDAERNVKDQKKPTSSMEVTLLMEPKSPYDGQEIESKSKRKLEGGRECRVHTKKVRITDYRLSSQGTSLSNDNNNNNNSSIKLIEKVASETTHPIYQVVSHDHGYLKASSPAKWEHTEQDLPQEERSSSSGTHYLLGQNAPQEPELQEESSDCTSELNTIKEVPSEDQSTLLHQHMNQELQGMMMAQDCGTLKTPLPVVGCEVEFTPDQQYKVMRSADLPIVYDQNNEAGDSQSVGKIVERDEYKVRKKPKGRAKFIGQSKAEKEMALKLITEIRSQSLMALDTLECKICNPPRLFTAPSTLLSHYRSHAGIRPYECRICEAVFTRQHSLNYHMLIHTNQTRFTCVDCGRKFRHPSHFKEHRRRHTGESPYECSDCLMRFKTRNTYKRHLRTRHGKLLTTQGAIIILSQEEADRMKKNQGRKPRKPRQPLKIITPEAAAQMEEEQVWTDFEEGDREEEEEEEEEEEKRDESNDALQFSKQCANVVSTRVPSGNSRMVEGIQQKNNGKTRLLVKSKKVNVIKSSINKEHHLEDMKIWDNSAINCVNRVISSPVQVQERVEEVVTEEIVEKVHTYVFQPPPDHNTLPKVNIQSPWNTVTIDLKNLEMATDAVIVKSESEVNNPVEDAGMLSVTEELKDGVVDACTEYVGDHITSEVITICAGMNKVVPETNSVVKHDHPVTGSNCDWFTVKKPLKCYGKSANILDTNDASTVITEVHPDDNSEANSRRGLYVVEYVQGQDGRMAKVYRASAALVSKDNRSLPDEIITGTTTALCSVANNETGSLTTGADVCNTGTTRPVSCTGSSVQSVTMTRLESNPGGEAKFDYLEVCNAVSGDTIATAAQISAPNTDQRDHILNKSVLDEQVVRNVELSNHYINDGDLLCESSGDNQGPTVTLHSSPSVIVTTVPHVTDVQQLSDSPSDFLPWPSQMMGENSHTVIASQVIGGRLEENKSKDITEVDTNGLGYTLINQNVQQFVEMRDDLLLDNVEIVDGEDRVVSVNCW
ncbi:hypothetical protein Pmani_015229 [Petrolisthes manimaculis]|uniref:C2H2-type domain-containing protein n=1 Tax=Petrolisthes manimaculis TaxID=1843537 RepID=A0AAE1PSM6_9EUCA|nr:hypothetical protein Pmani_015229 [Petrolisthes manimaculis]